MSDRSGWAKERREGWDAYHNGVPKHDNPYGLGKQKHMNHYASVQWRGGWEDAEEDDPVIFPDVK